MYPESTFLHPSIIVFPLSWVWLYSFPGCLIYSYGYYNLIDHIVCFLCLIEHFLIVIYLLQIIRSFFVVCIDIFLTARSYSLCASFDHEIILSLYIIWSLDHSLSVWIHGPCIRHNSLFQFCSSLVTRPSLFRSMDTSTSISIAIKASFCLLH